MCHKVLALFLLFFSVLKITYFFYKLRPVNTSQILQPFCCTNVALPKKGLQTNRENVIFSSFFMRRRYSVPIPTGTRRVRTYLELQLGINGLKLLNFAAFVSTWRSLLNFVNRVMFSNWSPLLLDDYNFLNWVVDTKQRAGF